MASEKSREMAAQMWCRPETSHIAMDCELAEGIANALDAYKERINRAVMRGIENLPRQADASDFIRIQAAAGIQPLHGA